MRQLAHRNAPEPVILERSAPRRKAGQQSESHEPATTEIPKVRQGQPGDDQSDEPPTTEWHPPGAGAR